MNTGLFLVLMGALFLAFVLAVFRFFPTARSRTPADRFLTETLSRDDDRCWFGGGFFYYNLDCCDLRWQADPATLQGQNHVP